MMTLGDTNGVPSSPVVSVRSALAPGGVWGWVVRRQDAEDAAGLLEGSPHLHLRVRRGRSNLTGFY